MNRRNFLYFCGLLMLATSAPIVGMSIVNASSLDWLFSGYRGMMPNTAALFCVIGISFLIRHRTNQTDPHHLSLVICGGLVSLAGLISLTDSFIPVQTGISTLLISAQLLAAKHLPSGGMSSHSALNFVLTGVSLALLQGRRSQRKISEVLGFLVLITAFPAILIYIYGAEQIYGDSAYRGMSIQAGILFVICSAALLAANRNSRVMALFTSESLGGSAARKLLPAVVLIPTIIGWLRIVGQNRGLYDSAFGVVLTNFFSVLLMFAIIYFYSETIHKIDLRRARAELDLAEKELRFRELFDHSQGMICIHDLAGVLKTVNRAAISSLGYAEGELIGKNIRDLMPDENRQHFKSYINQIETEKLTTGLLHLRSKEGKILVWSFNNILVSEPEKEPYVLGHAQDVTELLEAQNALKNLSLTDDLTGLYNRRGFLTLAAQQIRLEGHEGTARGLTLMFADLDGLKKINDTYGHELGSDAIIQFSNILTGAMRSADLIARWGGDEFVILTIGSKDEQARMILDRINEMLDDFNIASNKPYDLACSIGVTPVVVDGTRTIEEMIATADEKMYVEKRRRKGNIGVLV